MVVTFLIITFFLLLSGKNNGKIKNYFVPGPSKSSSRSDLRTISFDGTHGKPALSLKSRNAVYQSCRQIKKIKLDKPCTHNVCLAEHANWTFRQNLPPWGEGKMAHRTRVRWPRLEEPIVPAGCDDDAGRYRGAVIVVHVRPID